jgi:hypothetical protein
MQPCEKMCMKWMRGITVICRARRLWRNLVLALLVLPTMGQAAGKLVIDETRWVSVGAGVRASVNFVEDAAPSSDDVDTDFTLNNARLYVKGQIFHGILATLTTEFDEDEESIRLFNGILRFEFTEALNVWLGRFTAPSDRANIQGPFYLLNLDFPFVSAFPAVFDGQNDGLAVWGELFDQRFKYQIGVFDGVEGAPNLDDHVLFAVRFMYNFFDLEPGYYSASTYYGAKKIFAIGAALQVQGDAAGTTDNPEDFVGFNLDVLFEYPLALGVITFEAAYYHYDRPLANLPDGDAFYVQGGFLFPNKIWVGQFQPVFRVQHLNVDESDTALDTTHYDLGLNYIIKGFDARLMFEYTRVVVDGGKDRHEVHFLAQVQI